MSKTATIASLVRAAARSETEFYETIVAVFEEQDLERVGEFFEKLNIPRSVGADANGLLSEIPEIPAAALYVTDLVSEHLVRDGIQRYLGRHVPQIKWHAGHPAAEGCENVLLLLRESMFVTTLRLKRLQILLDRSDDLTPQEWAIGRELMNRSYLSFRNFLALTAGDWMDAISTAMSRDDLNALFNSDKRSFYQLVDDQVRFLDEMREKIEARRQELTVTPEGFPPVKPPNYFGGDLMGRGPWKQFWTNLNSSAHHFRESVG